MGDGVEETVLLFIPPDFADEKDGVDHQTCDQQSKEDDAQNERDNLTPVEDNPADIERHRESDKADAQHDEKDDRFGSARDAHDALVYDMPAHAPQR